MIEEIDLMTEILITSKKKSKRDPDYKMKKYYKSCTLHNLFNLYPFRKTLFNRKEKLDDRYLKQSEFVCITKDFCKAISKKIIESGKCYRLPLRLGYIGVIKRRNLLHTKVVDYNTSKQNKKEIYFMNNHSGGYYVRWYWFKRTAIFRFKGLFHFKATRTNNRLLAKCIKVDNTINKYFESCPFMPGKV